MECQGNSGLTGSLLPGTTREFVFSLTAFFFQKRLNCGFWEKCMYMYNQMSEYWCLQFLAEISSEEQGFC